MHRLANPVQRYAWGSTTAIPDFLGVPADGEPVAEVWMGAHPLAPSALVLDDGPAGQRRTTPLDAALAERPEELLGAEVVGRYGARLPFLLKVLAAGAPLSLQVHPSAEQARAGYAREEEAGLERDSAKRSYRDPWHKPELVLALTPFRALAGFRPPEATLAVLDGLELDGSGAAAASPTLAAFRAALRDPDPAAALLGAFDVATGAGLAEVAGACEALAEASAARLGTGGPHAGDDAVVVELQRAHPADVGVLLSTLLHHVDLAPGECLFLGAGQPHAYLHGLGVEAMACSDNVLRAGLTHKHVDVPELRSVLDTTPAPVPRLEPRRERPGVITFQPPVDDVGLDVVDVTAAAADHPGPPPERLGPRIVLGLHGEPVLEGGGRRLVLRRGESVFVPAGEVLSAGGRGHVAVARLGYR